MTTKTYTEDNMWEILKPHIQKLDGHIPNGWEEYYRNKFNIAKRINPKTICEIGVRGGYSAFSFLCASPNAFYLGIDLNILTYGIPSDYLSGAKELLSENNFNAQIIVNDSQKMTNFGSIEWDLIHVDGDHSYSGCLHDLEIAHLNSKYILVDDYKSDEVKRAIDDFYDKYNNIYDKEYIESHTGEMLFTRKQQIKPIPIKTDKNVIEVFPSRDKTKLTEYINKYNPKSVLLLFNHGVGDIVMFLNPFKKLQEQFPNITFKLGIDKCLTYESVWPDIVLLRGDKIAENPVIKEFDMYVHIEFPMNEHQTKWTKGEYCCIEELGIEPVCGHLKIPKVKNKLVAVHFQITCLPGAASADEKTAEKVWNEIIEAGYIPLETHFQHYFHNPVNTKFPFIDAHVRKCKAQLSNLVSLIQNAGCFVGVVSGNFHIALSCLPPEKIFLLEKDFKAEHFTKLPIARANIKEYKGEVKQWLLTMP